MSLANRARIAWDWMQEHLWFFVAGSTMFLAFSAHLAMEEYQAAGPWALALFLWALLCLETYKRERCQERARYADHLLNERFDEFMEHARVQMEEARHRVEASHSRPDDDDISRSN